MVEAQILKELQEIKQLLSLQKEVLTLEEFCVYAGISKHQVYHLTSKGKIKFYRPFGKLIYFDTSEVVEFLKRNPMNSNYQKHTSANNYLINKTK